MNAMKRKLLAGETAVGAHVCMGGTAYAEMVCEAGFDYAWVDMEHTEISTDTLNQLLALLKAHDLPVIVRPIWNEPYFVKPILEMGADGIVFPMVSTPADAEKAVAACKYPPQGVRGIGPKRAVKYGYRNLGDYLKTANDEIMVFTQIETAEAVKNVSELAKVAGVTGFIIGPMDLSAALGHIGDWHHPDVVRTIEHIIDVVHRSGSVVGTSIGGYTEADFAFWMSRGIDFISAGSEAGYLSAGLNATAAGAAAAKTACGRK